MVMSQDIEQLKSEKAKLEQMLLELRSKKEEQQKRLDELIPKKDELYKSWSSTRDPQEATRIEMRLTSILREISSTQEEGKSLDMKIAGIEMSIKSLAKRIEDKEALQRKKWLVER